MTEDPHGGLTLRLAAFVQRTRFEDLPAEAITAARRSIFDTLGVMLAGSGPDSAPAKLLSFLDRWGGSPEATVIGHASRLPAPHAAMINGAMAHQFDFDDTHDAALVHPTASSLPAALAVAEARTSCPGKELLRAVVLANDLTCRFGLAVPGPYTSYDFLRGPVIGIWGATVAAAVLLELTSEETAWAFGHTLHQTAVTMECLRSGSDIRGLRDGFSARDGVTAAHMAKAGIRGDLTAIEGRYGVFNAFFRGEYTAEVIIDQLGQRYEGAAVALKPWPSSREGHAVLRAVLGLRERHGLSPHKIEAVRLSVGPTEAMYCEPEASRRHPSSRSDALQSLPFAVAVALQHGGVPLAAYTATGLTDPRVLRLAALVSHVRDPMRTEDWKREGTRVTIRLIDGTVLESTERPGLGNPDDPLTAALVRQKFRDCSALAAQPFSDAQADRLHEAVEQLDSVDVDELSAALRRQ